MRMSRPGLDIDMFARRSFTPPVLFPAQFREFDPADRRDHLRQPDAYLALRWN